MVESRCFQHSVEENGTLTRIVSVENWTFAELSLYIQELYRWGYPLQTVLLDLSFNAHLPPLKDYLLTKPSMHSPCLGVVKELRYCGDLYKVSQSVTLSSVIEKVPEISANVSIKKTPTGILFS
jgi:hypothetical protein